MSEYNWNLLEANFYFAPFEVEFSFSLQLRKIFYIFVLTQDTVVDIILRHSMKWACSSGG